MMRPIERIILSVTVLFNQPAARRPMARRRAAGACAAFRAARGFTLLEVIIVLGLLLVLIIAAIGAISFLDRMSRFQAQDTTALGIAQGKLEELQGTKYNPPLAPFTSSTYYTTNPVVLSLDKSGTSVRSSGALITQTQPVSAGHLVTVSVSYTNYGKPESLQLQTVVNQLSGGQP